MTDEDTEPATEEEYRNEIDRLAGVVVEEAEGSEDESFEAIHLEVDQHEWIGVGDLQTWINVLEHSPSGPREWEHLVNDSMSWREVIQTLAFDAMRNDLTQAISSRLAGE